MLFPDSLPHLTELILPVTKNIAITNNEEAKLFTARFLHSVLSSGPAEGLESFEISALLSENYRPIDLPLEAESPVELCSVYPLLAFPLSKFIPAGQFFSQIIEIKEPNSILCWGFATEHYDIAYSISRVDLPEPHTIVTEERVNSSECPAGGIRLLHSPGIYQIQWNNSFSWFRQKHLRFRTAVLRPLKHIHSKRPTSTQAAIQVTTNRPLLSTHNPLYIGVHITHSAVYFRFSNKLQEIPLSTHTEAPDVINSFLDSCEHPNIYVGLLTNSQDYTINIPKATALAVARDCDAIGLHYSQLTKSHTVLTVASDFEPRSSLVHKGKLLLSEAQVPLGDISRLPAAGLKTLLALTGPSSLIIQHLQEEPPALSLDIPVTYVAPAQTTEIARKLHDLAKHLT